MPENTTRVNVEGGDDGCLMGGRVTLIYATFPDATEAERIGAELVETRLAACLNIVPGVRSIYRWAGEVHHDVEVVGIVKTRVALASRVVGWIRVAHPYANPAVVVLPVVGGSADFLAWIVAETAGADAG